MPYLFFENDSLKSLLGGDRSIEKSKMDILSKLIYDLSKNSEMKIFIPFIVFGETYNKFNKFSKLNKNIISDYEVNSHLSEKLGNLFENKQIDFVPPLGSCFSIAKKFFQEGINPTDALIVSQALVDKYSTYILTTDNKISRSIVSGTIKETNQKLEESRQREKSLKVYKIDS
ncbi:MAG: hypothetical protein ACRC1M_07560 [Methanobacteriaceae archaeon]